ncbi:Arm DNA-binding domain-containing protein [Methylorubrum sp. B1-46]|uniref:Arm DNA-binding domain-containing protein n=1 Tax=Methylorubrum sp. B1-46 TaxID=2897334 RepID=UPI001E621D1C|nr:Arm DNA-binding domain-containing protein [Methylorubrum sp. B1-46]UGB26135.1 Arm DNA-binding domain-containing protein [Methylorubrum sp. B1-46]
MAEHLANGKQSKITVETLKALLREVGAAESEQRDPECPGLVLRVRPRAGVRWSYKGRLHGKEKRWDLGPAVATRDGIAAVREKAARIREDLRRNLDPMASKTDTPPIVAPPASWNWEAGVAAFLVHIARTRRPDTYTDYRRILENTKELRVLHGRRIADIEREDIAAAIRTIHERGVESHAAHVLRVVRSFWSWLAGDGQQRLSRVQPNLLYRLQPPERTRRENGDRGARVSAPATTSRKSAEPKLPSEASLGRALAIAESEVLDDSVSWAIGLLLYTAQRRRPIVAAYAEDFSWRDPNTPPGTVVWNVPAFYRKTARRRGVATPHRLPLNGSAAKLVDLLLEDEYEMRTKRRAKFWLFPVSYPKHKAVERKSPTMDPGALNHNLLAMPGVDLSPHGVRRAFHTYGKMHLGFTREESKLVLDHNEGRPGDATDAYDWDEEMNRKAVMLSKWGLWIDELRDAAVRADPLLRPENKEELASMIRKARYGKGSAAKFEAKKWNSRSFDSDIGEEI